MQCAIIKQFNQVICGSCFVVCTDIWRLIWGTHEININTAKTPLTDVFIVKKHSMGPIGQELKPSRMVNKAKEKYPGLHKALIPFSGKPKQKKLFKSEHDQELFKSVYKKRKPGLFQKDVLSDSTTIQDDKETLIQSSQNADDGKTGRNWAQLMSRPNTKNSETKTEMSDEVSKETPKKTTPHTAEIAKPTPDSKKKNSPKITKPIPEAKPPPKPEEVGEGKAVTWTNKYGKTMTFAYTKDPNTGEFKKEVVAVGERDSAVLGKPNSNSKSKNPFAR